MSIPLTSATTSTRPALRANFAGILRGEFLKVARLCWIMLILLTAGSAVGFWLGATSPDEKSNLQSTPLLFLYKSMESNLQVFRIFSGILLLILTSITISREYQYGTIRILLARGVGRLQLLFAKLTMLLLIAAALLVIFTIFIALLTCLNIFILSGNLNALHALTPSFWPNLSFDLLAVFINMLATILLATALNSLTRSLAIGLSASLVWFPLDNVAVLVMNTLQQVTHNNIWLNLTAYLLGPLLNRLPDWLVPVAGQSGYQSFGILPRVPVDATHALWVVGVYSFVFLVLALTLTEQRDTKE